MFLKNYKSNDNIGLSGDADLYIFFQMNAEFYSAFFLQKKYFNILCNRSMRKMCII